MVLSDPLRDALVRVNPTIPASALDQACPAFLPDRDSFEQRGGAPRRSHSMALDGIAWQRRRNVVDVHAVDVGEDEDGPVGRHVAVHEGGEAPQPPLWDMVWILPPERLTPQPKA